MQPKCHIRDRAYIVLFYRGSIRHLIYSQQTVTMILANDVHCRTYLKDNLILSFRYTIISRQLLEILLKEQKIDDIFN
jgi:hypothetical protein